MDGEKGAQPSRDGLLLRGRIVAGFRSGDNKCQLEGKKGEKKTKPEVRQPNELAALSAQRLGPGPR